MYIDDSIKKYIDDLAAKLPAPGGGSAAALTGTLGVGLILMVLNYTIGKEKYKKFEAELNQALAASKDLKKKLSLLIDRDVEAYKKVSATFSSEDGTIKEKSLKDAASVPIEICNCCYQAIKRCSFSIFKIISNCPKTPLICSIFWAITQVAILKKTMYGLPAHQKDCCFLIT